MDINEQIRKLISALETWLKAEEVARRESGRYTSTIYGHGFFAPITEMRRKRAHKAQEVRDAAFDAFDALNETMPTDLVYQFPDGRKFYDIASAYARAHETGQTAEIRNAYTGVLLMALVVTQPEPVR